MKITNLLSTIHLRFLSLIVAMLLTACQKAPLASGEGELLAMTDSAATQVKLESVGAGNSDWLQTGALGVDYSPAKETVIKAKIVATATDNGVSCAIDEKPDADKIAEKVKPLPLWFWTKSNKEKKLDDDLAVLLSFSQIKVTSELLTFLVRFKKDEFYHQSLWQVKPVENPLDKNLCIARAEICTRVKTDKATGVVSCADEWNWLSRIIAVPDVNAFIWSRGKEEIITAIRAEYLKLEQGILTTQVDNKIPVAQPWDKDKKAAE